MKRAFFFTALIALTLQAQDYTLGVGVYPGDPKENFGPSVRIDSTTYRNLALHRPAYHSSAYDYNLTAQLITDGIKDTALPRWIAVSTSAQGVLKKNEREYMLDGNWVTNVSLNGAAAWVQFELAGGAAPLEVDRVEVDGAVRAGIGRARNLGVRGHGFRRWGDLERSGAAAEGMARPYGRYPSVCEIRRTLAAPLLPPPFSDPRARAWQVNGVSFFRGTTPVQVAGPHQFSSAWKSAGAGEEWVYVDLGAPCTFDRVALSWIRRAAEGSMQVSDDAANWKTIAALPASGTSGRSEAGAAGAGALRARADEKPAAPEGYILSEMEVYGRAARCRRRSPAPAPRPTHLELAGGGWRMQRDSLVKAGGEALSKAGFDDADWMVATVPGTVLVSYLNAGAIPDPNFGDNQFMISDSFFYADFWYRNEFIAAAVVRRERRLAELRRHQLEGRRLPERREARPHRRRIHARPVRRHRRSCSPARRTPWPCAS